MSSVSTEIKLNRVTAVQLVELWAYVISLTGGVASELHVIGGAQVFSKAILIAPILNIELHVF